MPPLEPGTSFGAMVPTDASPSPRSVPPHRIKRRSVAFLQREDRTWSCFLVSYPDEEGHWRGHFSFRPSDGAVGEEVRTADIFFEPDDGEVHRKARQLGRPLLLALLDSALHVRSRRDDASPFLRRWFRDILAEHSTSPAEPSTDAGDTPPGLDQLRSLYASYRLDQVAHFIALLDPGHFEDAVVAILDGQGIDFGARDRLQLAMLVVAHIEERLPLPPFEVWVHDFLAHRDRYRAYTHALHREGRLP